MENENKEIMKIIAQEAIETLKIDGALMSRGKVYPTSLGEKINSKRMVSVVDKVASLHLPGKEVNKERDNNFYDIFKYIKEHAETIYNQELQSKRVERLKNRVSNETLINWDNLVPIEDVTTGKIIMANCNDFSESEVLYDTWVNHTSKDLRDNIQPIFAKIIYDPYDIRKFRDETIPNGQIKIVNRYRAPTWKTKSSDLTLEELKALECPPLIADFLSHLFPEKESRDFVINWLFHAFYSRCDTYLVLNAAKGVGKNTFWKLVKAFMGTENCKEPPVSSLDSGFNAFLYNNRMLFFDELRAETKQAIDRLKKYANEDQAIEFKGVDADKTFKTFNSCIISNNDLTSLHLGWDERRFSVPVVTNVKMTEAYTDEQLSDLNDRFEKDEELHAQFGHWVLKMGRIEDRWTAHSVYKTQRFWDIVHANLTLWEQFVIEKIVNREFTVVELNELRKEFKMLHGENAAKMPVDITKFKKLINNYRHYGKYKLGEIKGKGKEMFIEVGRDFLPDKKVEQSIEEVDKPDITNLLDI